MTAPAARKKMPSDREIQRVIRQLRELGIPVGAVDIRFDGVTVHPPAPPPPTPGNAFDQWLEQDAHRDRPARRS